MLTGNRHIRHVPFDFSITSNENMHAVVNGLQAIGDRRVLLRCVVAEIVPSVETRKHLVGLCANLAIVLSVCTIELHQ